MITKLSISQKIKIGIFFIHRFQHIANLLFQFGLFWEEGAGDGCLSRRNRSRFSPIGAKWIRFNSGTWQMGFVSQQIIYPQIFRYKIFTPNSSSHLISNLIIVDQIFPEKSERSVMYVSFLNFIWLVHVFMWMYVTANNIHSH